MRNSATCKFMLMLALLGWGCDEDMSSASSEESDAGREESVERASPLAADPACSGHQGMTWAKLDHDAQWGIAHVGCSSCDPYSGDTSCMTALPVLCIKSSAAAKPNGLQTDFYNGWTGGTIATTAAVQGTALTSLAAADLLCSDSYGPGWRMAEFHDGGGGWTWYAFGDVPDTRFWVHINDQPSNCWDS